MTERNHSSGFWNRWRIIGWAIPVGLLMLPLIFNAPWTLGDYVAMGIMFGGTGLMFELGVRMTRNHFYRGGIAAALAAAFLTVWVNLAVGMIGDEDNALNLMFAGVLAVAFLGAILARFEAKGMARAMTAAAVAQGLAGAVGMVFDLRGGILSAFFAGIWLLSAMLFGKAAEQGAAAAEAK